MLPRGWGAALTALVVALLAAALVLGLRADAPEPDRPAEPAIRAAPPPAPAPD